jgi:hypothetical protein
MKPAARPRSRGDSPARHAASRDEAEVDVQMVVGLAATSAERTRPSAGKRLASERGVAFDRLPFIEKRVAYAVDVDRGCPAMRRCVLAECVPRRSISAIRRDVHERPRDLAEPLE